MQADVICLPGLQRERTCRDGRADHRSHKAERTDCGEVPGRIETPTYSCGLISSKVASAVFWSELKSGPISNAALTGPLNVIV